MMPRLAIGGDVLDDVVVNVRNSGAGHGFGDDLYAIQRAINTRRHVLFPAGTYRIASGALVFRHDRQKVTFLAGAVLLLNGEDDRVRITGKDQVFNGLRIDAVERGGVAHEPILEIDGADRLLIRDFNVSCGPANVIVRVQDTRGLTLDSGRIHSSGNYEQGAIGVQLGEGAHEVRILATAIDNLDVSLEITATSRSVTVEACTFEATLTAAIRVGGVVEGLSLTGVHFEGRATGAITGAWRFIHVVEGAAIRGARSLAVSSARWGCGAAGSRRAGRSLSKVSSKASSSAGATTGLATARRFGRSPAQRRWRRAATSSPIGLTRRCREARTQTACRSSRTPPWR